MDVYRGALGFYLFLSAMDNMACKAAVTSSSPSELYAVLEPFHSPKEERY